MPELDNHRAWLASLLLSTLVLIAPLFLGVSTLQHGYLWVIWLLAWCFAVAGFVGLTIADCRLAKAVGLDLPSVVVVLIYLTGLWPVATLVLDLIGMQTVRESRRRKQGLSGRL